MCSQKNARQVALLRSFSERFSKTFRILRAKFCFGPPDRWVSASKKTSIKWQRGKSRTVPNWPKTLTFWVLPLKIHERFPNQEISASVDVETCWNMCKPGTSKPKWSSLLSGHFRSFGTKPPSWQWHHPLRLIAVSWRMDHDGSAGKLQTTQSPM